MPSKPPDDEPDTVEDEGPMEFELTEEDVKALSEAKSEVVADEPSAANTPYTIHNAPIAKSIMPPEAFVPVIPAHQESQVDDNKDADVEEEEEEKDGEPHDRR